MAAQCLLITLLLLERQIWHPAFQILNSPRIYLSFSMVAPFMIMAWLSPPFISFQLFLILITYISRQFLLSPRLRPVPQRDLQRCYLVTFYLENDACLHCLGGSFRSLLPLVVLHDPEASLYKTIILSFDFTVCMHSSLLFYNFHFQMICDI